MKFTFKRSQFNFFGFVLAAGFISVMFIKMGTNKTFNINPIRKPTAASVVVNPNKTININWTAPLKTANGVNIDISTWSGYHFYVYNSVQKIAHAFQLAGTTIKTFTSPIALAPGSYSVRIVPHLVNGGLGTGSDILNVVIP